MKTDGEQAPMKVLLHVRSLHIGGSERQVVALAKSMTALGNEVHVATIISGGPLERDLADIPNVQLHSLGGSGLKGRLRYPFRLRSLIRSNRFDAVYGFLPTPNLGLLVARTVRRRPVIAWGVRSSGLDLSQYSDRVKWAIRLEKWLSRFADHIITNSQSALDEYTQDGYPARNSFTSQTQSMSIGSGPIPTHVNRQGTNSAFRTTPRSSACSPGCIQ